MTPVHNLTPTEFRNNLTQTGSMTLVSGARLIIGPIECANGNALATIQQLFTAANYKLTYTESGVLGKEKICEVLEDKIQITIGEGCTLVFSAESNAQALDTDPLTFSSQQAFCDHMLTGEPITFSKECPLLVKGVPIAIFDGSCKAQGRYEMCYHINRLLEPVGRTVKPVGVDRAIVSWITNGEIIRLAAIEPVTIEIDR